MNKYYSLIRNLCVASLLLPLITQAQSGFTCGTDQMRAKLIAEHPEILQQEQEMDVFTRQFIADGGASQSQRSGPIIIPLVFHILHKGGNENISDQQVMDEVRILNEDYNKRNADTADVISEFKSIIADVGIEFRLAKIDPNGNCTNGIEHIYSSQAILGGGDFAKLNPWPREKYLNVWVVNKLEDGVAGYAYYPSSVSGQAELPGKDGVIILQNYIGSIGTSSYYTSRALTHEIGHYLNLKHCWGDSNNPGVACGDDDVQDTPETKGWLTCPSPANSAVCNPPIKENFQNYMEYSYCSRMFTNGQKDRMLAALNSGVSSRSSLWSSANLSATGIEDTTASQCAPICDFSVNKYYVCSGTPVTFSDDSYNGDITARNWEFENADITTSTDKKPVVTFFSPGRQKVGLDVINNYGSSSKTTTPVFVYDPTIQFGVPYYNDFEDKNDFDYMWATENIDKDLPKFEYTSTAAHSGSSSIRLENYYSRTDHNQDDLVSPAFDCTNLTNNDATLSFYYSYASWNDRFSLPLGDSMVVYASKTCGASWVKIYANGSNSLVNAGYQPAYYVPETGPVQAQWKKVSITIPTAFRTEKVHFKVSVFGMHQSNNFYLDDWNVGLATTGIDEKFANAISVMPNPFDANVQIQGLADGKYDISVMDITGREVINMQGATPVNGNINMDMTPVTASGVYLVKVYDGKTTGTLKLVKK